MSTKKLFFDDSPVVTSALNYRPILPSIIFAGALYVTGSAYSPQFLILLIGVLNCMMVYFLARNLIPQTWAFAAALLVTLNPNLYINNRLTLSEPMFLFLVLTSLIILYSETTFRGKFVLLGVIIGLSYLTRSEGLLMLISIIISLTVWSRIKFPKFRTLLQVDIKPQTILNNLSRPLMVLMGFGIITAPYILFRILLDQNPFHSVSSFHYRIYDFSDGSTGGFQAIYPSTYNFVTNNLTWIMQQIGLNTIEIVRSLLSLPSLGLLSMLILFTYRSRWKQFLPFILFVVLNILTLSMTWSLIFEVRHLTAIYILLLIFSFRSINTRFLQYAAVIIFIITIGIYILYDIHRFIWTWREEAREDTFHRIEKTPLFSWIQSNTTKKDIIAYYDPYLLNLFTDRPTVVLTEHVRNSNQLKAFSCKYNVRYFITDKPDEIAFFQQNTQYITNRSNFSIFRYQCDHRPEL